MDSSIVTLKHLEKITEDMEKLKSEMCELKNRLDILEGRGDNVGQGVIDKIEDRLREVEGELGHDIGRF